MQVEGLVPLRRDPVYIEAGQGTGTLRCEQHTRLFNNLAARRLPERGVLGLDMTTGEQPAVEPPMVDEKEALPVRREHEPGTGDVAWGELPARERLMRMREKHKDQLPALYRSAIGIILESASQAIRLRRSGHMK